MATIAAQLANALRIAYATLDNTDEQGPAREQARKALAAYDAQQSRYVVDGTTYPNDPDGPLFAGDGQHAPFVVFDIERQENLPGRYDTRAEAEAVIAAIEGADHP